MAPEQRGQDVYFSVSEAARILEMPRQSIYAAINTKRLPATNEAYGRKIHVKDLLAYGIQGGKSPPELIARIQEHAKADLQDLLIWLLAGLGLFFLIKTLLGKD